MKLFLRSMLVICVTLISIFFNMPNYIENPLLAKSKINLGLDLQGGSHVLLEVNMESYINDQLDNFANSLKKTLRECKMGYKNFHTAKQKLSFELRDNLEKSEIEKLIHNLDSSIFIDFEGSKINLQFSENKILDLQNKVIDQSIEIIRMRIDSSGTKEPILHRQGDRYILLQVPGAENPQELKKLLGQTAKLTFHLVDESADVNQVMQTGARSDQILVESRDHAGYFYVIKKQPELTGDMLIDASANLQNSQAGVAFEFNSMGARLFAEVTKNNVGKRLAIVLDGQMLSAPNINESINGGRGIISGNYTLQSAGELALLLRAGALPAPLNIIEERNVGPSLGVESIIGGKKAATIGMAGVMIFMIWTYGIFGLFANIALMAGISYIIAIIGAIGATLTLPGIAGIILTMGMAVDANILIYERIREEAKKGLVKGKAIRLGFESAFATIADSNITTLIAAALLYLFGSGVIKGFAVTLSIGILASMFSAIVVTKLLIDLWLQYSSKTTQISF